MRESKRFMALAEGTFGGILLGTQTFADTERDGRVKVTQSLDKKWVCFQARILTEAYFKCWKKKCQALKLTHGFAIKIQETFCNQS